VAPLPKKAMLSVSQAHAVVLPNRKTINPYLYPFQKQILRRNKEMTMWKKIRSGLMFAIACVASPCCTPLIVPLGLALLAGTPIAVWASANLGWVYGALTLLSIVSLVLGFRWLGARSKRENERSTSSIVHPLKQS